ncbi:DNA polymerase III subunit epsilon [Salipiger mucosus]|uniref:DNA polymerase III subunit epsilon n=1 Tax=Salipiger mucosus DSM 16094 TaxID=1123237 RepID=S9QV87_9RHOB|nr:DNA polymerase III subunit epsilon [Salipiger mucosus]EPX83482.1 DNA polymerase III epsilon subunit [Salipiger mucosus DSM 16094]
MQKDIVFDTETTGFSPEKGDRIVEVGCVELVNFVPTGREFHVYINPERSVPLEAAKIHGLKTDFLKDKPVFADIVDDFLEFIGDGRLVAHNATFDMKFIKAEVKKAGRPALTNSVVDSLVFARKKLPHKGSHSLDTLLNHYKIDKTSRSDGHGALIDAHLLAKLWLELNGGANYSLDLEKDQESKAPSKKRTRPNLRKGLARKATGRAGATSARTSNGPDTTPQPDEERRDSGTQASVENKILGLVEIKPSETEVCENKVFREANGFPEKGYMHE